MLARIPVGEAENGFMVSEAPPTVAADERPEPVGHAGVETVRWNERAAPLGGKVEGLVGQLRVHGGRCVVFAHGRERAGVAMVASDKVQ